MIVKVCGMKYKENIEQLLLLKPDYMGLIFYPPSLRYMGNEDPDFFYQLGRQVKLVGVFVNESYDVVAREIRRFGLSVVQLHGDESPQFVRKVKELNVEVIKVFRVGDAFDKEELKRYEGSCDYFLFDTMTKQYGGSGHKFQWDILDDLQTTTPWFLSGGIGPEDLDSLSLIDGKLYGVDLNSKFEDKPALKNIDALKSFITGIRVSR
ncbi:phosphoribosylanthranilate isomerase [Puteibacter caeruleilacunae]|nr:phosphoribosylanthranilate isomerase [Puteibacter caeruleilacunae]